MTKELEPGDSRLVEVVQHSAQQLLEVLLVAFHSLTHYRLHVLLEEVVLRQLINVVVESDLLVGLVFRSLMFEGHLEVIAHPFEKLLADQDECFLQKQPFDLILQVLQRPLLDLLLCTPLSRLFSTPSLSLESLLVDGAHGLGDYVETFKLLGPLLGLPLLLGCRVLLHEVALEVGLILLARGRNDLGTLCLRLLGWSLLTRRLMARTRIVTQVLVDHERVDVWIWVQSTTVSRVAEPVTLLFAVLTQLRSLLANLLNALYLLLLLEISLLDLLDSLFVLELESIELVHTHVHDVLLRTGVHDELRQVRRQSG